MRKSFALAWLQIARFPLTSFIVVAAIAISVMTAGLLLRLDLLSKSRFNTFADVGNTVLAAKAGAIEILLGAANLEANNPDPIPENLYSTTKAGYPISFEDGVTVTNSAPRWIAPILICCEFRNMKILGTENVFFQRGHEVKFFAGRTFENSDEIVVGSSFSAKNNLKLGDRIKLNTTDGPEISVRISGILARTGTVWDLAGFIPLQLAQSTMTKIASHHSWQTHILHYILMDLEPRQFPGYERLIRERTVSELISVDAARARLLEITQKGEYFGIGIMILILFLATITSIGILLTRFEYLQVQTAIFQALGWSSGEISLWLIFQGMLLAGIGTIIGIGLDAILFELVRPLLGSAFPDDSMVHIPLWSSWPVWLGVNLSVVLALVLPVLRTRKIDVASVLRGI
jgi:hypothetical protein